MLDIFLLSSLASLIAGSLCGSSGVLVARLRASTLVFGIAHGALCGAALGMLFNVDPLYPAMALALATSFIVGPVSDFMEAPVDIVSMLLFSIYNALTFISLASSPGPVLAVERVGAIMWGSVLAVTKEYLVTLVATLYLFLLILTLLWGKIQVVLFDRELAEAEGARAKLYFYTILSLIGAVVAISFRMVGGFLVFSLLYIPSAFVIRLSINLKKMLILASLIGAASALSGLALSFILNLPVGACIVLASSSIFITLSITLYFKRKALLRRASRMLEL